MGAIRLTCLMMRPVQGERDRIWLDFMAVPRCSRRWAEAQGWQFLADDTEIYEQAIEDERVRAETFWQRCVGKR